MNIRAFLFFITLTINLVAQASVENQNIYIFVSFSMPAESLEGWMKEAQIIGAPIVIRGLVNNSFKDTIQKISTMTKNNKSGMQLNPKLFEKYQIDKVPAVVVAESEDCLPNQTCRGDYDKIYGDVTLLYALQKINNLHDFAFSTTTQYLTKLRDLHV